MNFRNPYDSILVLRALIQEIMYQVSKAYKPDELAIAPTTEIQKALDELSCRVEFRGTPLHKLVAIELRQSWSSDTPTSLDFVLRPLSEDGRVYLKLLKLEDTPSIPVSQAEATRVHVRRIVEI